MRNTDLHIIPIWYSEQFKVVSGIGRAETTLFKGTYYECWKYRQYDHI